MTHTPQYLKHDEDALRRRGQRLTPQRRLVLEIMQATHGHMTVDDVVRETRQRNDTVSVASVYRILAWLAEHELISVTDVGERDLVYEYLGHGRHHHLVCTRCGVQTEVPFDLLTPLVAELRDLYGFEARLDHQAIFGRCQHCGPAWGSGVGCHREGVEVN